MAHTNLVILDPVMTKGTKRTPSVASSYTAKIVVKKSIEITRQDKPANMFKMGDMAEYDSYNLSYYGPIIQITAKTVTIQSRHSDRVYRLDIERFCWRNYNFKLAETQTENEKTSWCI